MAYKSGTRINPQLGALDFSAITDAAQVQAAALQDLGNKIGDAIVKSKEKKQKKAIISSISGAIKNQPEIAQALGFDPMTLEDEDVSVAASTVFDTFGMKGSQALLAEVFASNLKGDRDTLDLQAQVKFENALSESTLGENYRIKDGKLFNKRLNRFVSIEDTDDPILQDPMARMFVETSTDPLALPKVR